MAFLMRKGEGKAAALYTRCADEAYCQAELLLLLEKAPPGPVIGYYDVDPSFPISRSMEAYRGREDEINRALERVRRGEFNFEENDIMRLTPGVEQESPTPEEKEQRIATLVKTVEHYLPEFAKGVKHAAREYEARKPKPKDGQNRNKKSDDGQPTMVLHQDAFAAGYHKDEYTLLGLAIKYAGLHDVGVTIMGKND